MNKKTNWIVVCVLLLLAAGLGSLFVLDKTETRARESNLSEIERLETTVYTKPQPGMLLTKLLELCGKDSDDFKESETARGKITTVTFKSTPERVKKGCAGRFTFSDYRLELISQ